MGQNVREEEWLLTERLHQNVTKNTGKGGFEPASDTDVLSAIL